MNFMRYRQFHYSAEGKRLCRLCMNNNPHQGAVPVPQKQNEPPRVPRLWICHNAFFQVSLYIHQISGALPLCDDFAVKWQFENAQSLGVDCSGSSSIIEGDSLTPTSTFGEETEDCFTDGDLPTIYTSSDAASEDTLINGNSQDCPWMGTTAWIKPSRYNVATFDYRIVSDVRMDINQETRYLKESELKLTVLQVLYLHVPAAP